MIKSKADTIRHPIIAGSGCVTLQYADDVLIVLKGDPDDVEVLKGVLNSFSNATGLSINYIKARWYL